MSESEKDESKAIGGNARAMALTPEKRKEIAKKAAVARWGTAPLQATHMGNFKEDFGIDVKCYVLNDEGKTAVISQRGMAEAIGLSKRGDRLQRFSEGKSIFPYIGPELRSKLDNPLIFQFSSSAQKNENAKRIHGYDVTILIDLCKSILKAQADGVSISENVARQAQIVLQASAKAGIRGLVYALAGYDQTREEIITAFKLYVQEEAKKYEKEFPQELYTEWHRLYEIPVLDRGRSWHFKHLTVRHIYYPLAQSKGKILELVRMLKLNDGDRKKKLFQFLNEIGARALRMQLGRVLEMTQSSKTKTEYENKITERFGGQQELELNVN